MIKIGVLPFNPFQENTYVVWDESGECVVVDAGNCTPKENETLSKYLETNNLKPVAAVNTHGHFDHIAGVCYLQDTYGIPFALSAKDQFLVEAAPTHAAMYGMSMAELPTVDIDLEQCSEFKFGNSTLQIITTPGHTPGHVCLYNAENKLLLTGDTLFRESIGRTDLPGGDYSWIMRSILEKIMPLGEAVRIFPGHGPSSDLGHEALYNPFITEVLGGEVKHNV